MGKLDDETLATGAADAQEHSLNPLERTAHYADGTVARTQRYLVYSEEFGLLGFLVGAEGRKSYLAMENK